jgi:hypothetical protein
MNYLKVYCNLIRKAENRILPDGYTEKHHTFPKSIFGNNNRIVILTLREHYIAHCLLVKAFAKRYGVDNTNTKKMINALWCMSNKNKYSNSHIYESLRKQVVELYTGENNPAKRPEIREKISKANTGRVHTEETRNNMSKAKKGKRGTPKSEETREKIRKALTGKTVSEEVRKKLSEINKGKKLSQEIKNKISQSNKGRIVTQETRDKISQSNKGRIIPEEQILKMKEAQKGEKHHSSKLWKITFNDGSEITTWALTGWAKENGYVYSCAYNVYTGKYKKHKDIVKVEVVS